MSSHSTQPSSSLPAETELEPPATTAESDASCRVPVTLMFFSAVCWLALSTIFSLIAAVKCHSPSVLGNCPYMTYGKVQAAANSLLIYGFAIQAGLGAMLWLLCRSGKTILFQPVLATFGAIFWNLAVTIGVVGIFAGDQSGYEWLEFPQYANLVLLLAYLAIGLVAGLTFHDRSSRKLEPEQWFAFGALFWFPWIFSTAVMLLQVSPVRGVMQAVVNNWYGASLINVWMAFVGLALIFHLLPAETKRPIRNRNLAQFAFWTLALFGGWGGLYAGMPIPSWLPSISSMFTILTIVPVIAIALSLHHTFNRDFMLMRNNTLVGFLIVGACAYVIYTGFNFLNAIQELNTHLQFTYFTAAIVRLGLYGFFTLTLCGAIYHIVPQITGRAWPKPKWVKANLWLGGVGIAVFVFCLSCAGVFQGWPGNRSFMDVATSMQVKMSFRASTLGDLLILVAQCFMLANFKLLLFNWGRDCCKACCASASKTAEVTA